MAGFFRGFGRRPSNPARAGLLAGLALESTVVQIRWPEEVSEDDHAEIARRAGIVVGHLLRSDFVAGGEFHDSLRPEISYATALVTPQGQRALGGLSEKELIKAHTFACIVTERRGLTLSVPLELRLLSWLFDQADPQLAKVPSERAIRERERRHAFLASGR